jgi:hypothetical protein
MIPFANILDACRTLSTDLPEVVFIGGVAVYLHTSMSSNPMLSPETSHDADFMVSLSNYGVLRDATVITHTPRLSKHQMKQEDIEFGVYVERQNALVVPFDEVFAHSKTIEQIRVASLEHLLILKLEAFKSRVNTPKGDKDERDVAKIGLLLGRRAKHVLITPYLRDDLLEIIHKVSRSLVFFELCEHNAHVTKKARTAFANFVSTIA